MAKDPKIVRAERLLKQAEGAGDLKTNAAMLRRAIARMEQKQKEGK